MLLKNMSTCQVLWCCNLKNLAFDRRGWDRIYYWDTWWVPLWKNSAAPRTLRHLLSKNIFFFVNSFEIRETSLIPLFSFASSVALKVEANIYGLNKYNHTEKRMAKCLFKLPCLLVWFHTIWIGSLILSCTPAYYLWNAFNIYAS